MDNIRASDRKEEQVVVAENSNSAAKRKNWLERNPPPPISACTVEQIAALHPGINQSRLRTWIVRADAGDPQYAWLALCIIRIGRSLFIDEVRLRSSLHQYTGLAAAPARNQGRAIPSPVSKKMWAAANTKSSREHD